MAEWTSLIVAGVGVGGTLFAPLLTQRSARKARQLEAEIQSRESARERDEQKAKDDLAQRRAIYTDLISTARNYRGSLVDFYASWSGKTWDHNPPQDALETARSSFAEYFSRAQMIVPEPVLLRAQAASYALGDAYRLLTTRPAQDAPALSAREQTEIVQGSTRTAVTALRDAMRADLGIKAV